jgi:hypothetical protein
MNHRLDKMKDDEWWDNFPAALRPAYAFGEVNEPISLYKGELEIEKNQRITQGNGEVYFKWFPYPQIEFKLSSNRSLIGYDTGETKLKLTGIQGLVKVRISELNRNVKFNEILNQVDDSIQVRGRPIEPIIIGSGNDLAYIKFHLTNFHELYGSCKSVFVSEDFSKTVIERVVFEAGIWRVTIDQLEIETISKILKSLEFQGGYGVTHVGKLERNDQTVFAANEARDFLEAFSYFLSFVRGFRVSPTLLVGYNVTEEEVWKEWTLSNSDPWKFVYSWASSVPGTSLKNAFPGFWQWWQDWGKSAKLAVYWYLQSNRNAGGTEGSIILSQAALELLSWVKLVEKGSISKEDFERKKQFDSTSKKINKLLTECGIPKDIPSEFIDLAKFESQLPYSNNNGACAFVELRNSITHSAPKNRDRFTNTSIEAIEEAWILGLWYVEMVILKLCNYNDSYFNRIQKKAHFGDLESVPWK